jgi:hypothetical protein
MRKSIVLGLSALAIALLVALVPRASTAALGDANGPACRDITGPAFNYTSTTTPGVYNLSGMAQLGPTGETAPCKNITYTLYVITDPTNIATATEYPQSGNNAWLNIPVTDTDKDICVIATTSTGRVFDIAPDTPDCYPLTADTTGSPGGFN